MELKLNVSYQPRIITDPGGWFGENDVECHYTIYTDESNTYVSVEWKMK